LATAGINGRTGSVALYWLLRQFAASAARWLYLFFIIELGTRRVAHVGVTNEPTQAQAAQQWWESTLHGQVPRFIIRDNEARYGCAFDEAVRASDAEVIRTVRPGAAGERGVLQPRAAPSRAPSADPVRSTG
jgi:hypothetical protein